MDSLSYDVHRLEFGVDWPPWTSAAYLLETDEPVLIDSGAPGDRGWQELQEGLDDAGLRVREIDHLVLTHPHSDHIGQAARVIPEAMPMVYASLGARERLQRSTEELAANVRRNARRAGLEDERVSEETRKAVESLERNRGLLPPQQIDRTLTHGETRVIGGVEFQTIHTPGHQKDHLCFLAGDALFSGDMVIRDFRSAALNVGLDDGVYDSIQDFYTAYRRLEEVHVDAVYPGHGPVFSDAGGAVQQSVEDLDELVGEVEDLLGEPGTAYELTRRRVEEPRRFTFSLLETMGALGYLRRNDRAVSSGDPLLWSAP